MQGTVLESEATKFNALAGEWWNPRGPMAPLHAMNTARTRWVLEQLPQRRPLRLLDIGCGAGLAAEAFARAGLQVTGMDAAPDVIEVARQHAQAGGLEIDYRHGGPEDLAPGTAFDVVTALEVIEHVADKPLFLASLRQLLPVGGQLFLSTLNRTRKSLLIAKYGAEYVLRLLPVGTHDWHEFVTPAELSRLVREAGFAVEAISGLGPRFPDGQWRAGGGTSVNYLMACRAV